MELEPKKIENVITLGDVRKNCAPSASDEEFKNFLYLCKQYDLNPLKKEIYFLKYGGKVAIIISRDGLFKIANQHAAYDGVESDSVYKDDILTRRDNGSIQIAYGPHHYSFNKAMLEGAFCNVYRKDKSIATTVYVSFAEYKKDSPIWKQYSNTMIIKTAEVAALKKAFELSGLKTDETEDETELENQ